MTKKKSNLRLGGSLVALAVAALLTSPAAAQVEGDPDTNAQDQQTPVAPPSTGAEPAPVDSDGNEEEIIVTGSLIQRPNNVAVSPILTVTDDLIEQSGQVTIEDALNQLPGFTPSTNAATGGQGAGGRAGVNLRGLGTNRNLVLLDGRRLPLSDINGNVDTNIIPEALIGEVDVITGGASAIYGSDAMSGVVNFKTLRWFDGIIADVQYGQSFRGDVEKFNGSATFGTSFNEDRGKLMLSLSYADREPLSGADRKFFADKVPSSFIGTGTFQPDALNLPDQAVLNGLFASYGVNSNIGRTLNLGFNDDGTLFTQTGALNYKGPTTGAYAVVGGNVRMPVGPQLQILNGLERKAAFAKGEYDFTDSITGYGQFLYVDSTVNTESGSSLTQFAPFTTIPITNPFIPDDLATLLASRGNPAAPFQWRARYIGLPDKNWDENYKVQQYLGGVRADLFGDWRLDAFVAWDSTDHTQSMHHAVLKTRVQTLLNAPDGGASICAGGFNPFSIANASQLSEACQNYISTTAIGSEELSQTQVQAQIDGSVFELPAGAVKLALLGVYRKNKYESHPSPDLQSNNIEAVVASNPAKGDISVKEFAAQIDVPLLGDMSFAQELAVGGAFRYSDYNTVGGVSSWEVDARWRPVRELLIRGSYQRAVRAPNIGELFSPVSGQQLAFGTPPAAIGDPCDIRSIGRTGPGGAQVRALCLAQGIPAAAIDSYIFPTTATGQNVRGNPDVTPEKAKTWNAGFVFNPAFASPWLSGFSMSVDYYNIKISNVISIINGLTVLSNCYNLSGLNPTYSADNVYCQLVERDVTGLLTAVNSPYFNLGALETDGVDLQLTWGVKLSDIGVDSSSGRFYVNTAVGWLNHYKVQALPGSPVQDFAGTSAAVPTSRPLPKWKALTTVGYDSDLFGIGLRWRYQSKLKDISSVTSPTAEQVGVPTYHLFDLFGTVGVNETIELRAGITNLFDRKIPTVSNSQNLTDAAVYDVVGRAFYAGAKVTF